MAGRPVVITLFISALAACASAPRSTVPSAETSSAARKSPDLIDSTELADPSLANLDALTIIKRLRPSFLVSRGSVSANNSGGELHVVVDAGTFRTAGTLETIRGAEIVDIRYLSATAAAQRFGSRALAGPVIVIRRK
jgi:hypothetical protein